MLLLFPLLVSLFLFVYAFFSLYYHYSALLGLSRGKYIQSTTFTWNSSVLLSINKKIVKMSAGGLPSPPDLEKLRPVECQSFSQGSIYF